MTIVTQTEAAAISSSKFPDNQDQLGFDYSDPSMDSDSVIIAELANADIIYVPNFLSRSEADQSYQHLLAHIPFESASIKLYGKETLIPRLQSWHGDEGIQYSYSGKTLMPKPWTPALRNLSARSAKVCNQHGRPTQFNSVLCNLYRDGQDSMGWHSDDEPELGINPIIASVSLGEERVFKLQHKKDKSLKWQVALQHGSLLIMAGETQHYWRHHIAKSQRPMRPRINLTFRHVHSAQR